MGVGVAAAWEVGVASSTPTTTSHLQPPVGAACLQRAQQAPGVRSGVLQEYSTST